MIKKTLPLFFLIVFLLPVVSYSHAEKFIVLHQVTGPIQTNCYLLYDVKSKEAALVDPGGPVDSLTSAIMDKKLKLKYVFITHCHPDHIQGLPIIKKSYPQAKMCFSREEYEDMVKLYSHWESTLNPEAVAEAKKNPEIVKMMNLDIQSIGKPDVFVGDNQIYKLGHLKRRTLLSPGHSRGSICYHAGNVLFSGDVLFHRTVGRTDLPMSGGKEGIVRSVRRLYTLLPDETIVYPGHGRFTDIGSEKKENKKVTIDKVNI